MKHETFVRSLVVAVVSLSALTVLASSNPNAVAEGDSEWQEIYYQLFNNKSLELKPEETQEMLGRLEQLYAKRENGQFTDQFRELLEAGELETTRCQRPSFEHLNRLIEHYDPLYENLVAYLEHQRIRLAEFCSPIFETGLREAVARINEQSKREVEILVDKLAANTKNATRAQLHLGFTDLALEQAIKSFLKDPETHRPVFGSKADLKDPNRVARLCGRVGSKLIPPLQFYDELVVDLKVPVPVGDLTLEWLNNLQVCFRVLSHFENQLDEEELEIERKLRRVKLLVAGIVVIGALAG